MENKLLTTRQVAEMLGVTPEYLNKIKRQWRLPYIRISQKALRYKKVDIESWIENQNKEVKK